MNEALVAQNGVSFDSAPYPFHSLKIKTNTAARSTFTAKKHSLAPFIQ